MNNYDYPGDSLLENGNYMHECPECKLLFLGHKRRVICNRCANNTLREHPSE